MNLRAPYPLLLVCTLLVMGGDADKARPTTTAPGHDQAEVTPPQRAATPPAVTPPVTTPANGPKIVAGEWSEVDDAPEPDDEIESIIKPYRDQLQVVMLERDWRR